MTEVQQWKADEIGQILTIRQEIEVRRRAEAGQPLTLIGRATGLPVELVRQVAAFGNSLETNEGRKAVLVWFNERFAERGDKCPRCRAKLTIVPCRACRWRQYIAEQQRAGG